MSVESNGKMNKIINVLGLFGLFLILLSCTNNEIKNTNNNSKEVIVYYSPAHIRGARTYMPMTEKRIRREMTKKITSPKLYNSIESIIHSSCSGTTPDDNLMILAQINTGKIAIHQNGRVSVKNRVCNNIAAEQTEKLILLMRLKAVIYKSGRKIKING